MNEKKIPNALKVGRKSDCSQIGTAAAATFDAENLNWLLNWNWRWTFRLSCLLFRRKKIKNFNIKKVNEKLSTLCRSDICCCPSSSRPTLDMDTHCFSPFIAL